MSGITWPDGNPFFEANLKAFTQAIAGEAVANGVDLSAGSGDRDVDVSTGQIYNQGNSELLVATTVTIDSADPNKDRWDLIFYDFANSAVEIKKGTPADKPYLNTPGENEVMLGGVYVEAGSSTVVSSDILQFAFPAVDGQNIISGISPDNYSVPSKLNIRQNLEEIDNELGNQETAFQNHDHTGITKVSLSSGSDLDLAANTLQNINKLLAESASNINLDANNNKIEINNATDIDNTSALAQFLGLVIENRTSDPSTVTDGRLIYRTDTDTVKIGNSGNNQYEEIGGLTEAIAENRTSDPGTVDDGKLIYRTDENKLKVGREVNSKYERIDRTTTKEVQGLIQVDKTGNVSNGDSAILKTFALADGDKIEISTITLLKKDMTPLAIGVNISIVSTPHDGTFAEEKVLLSSDGTVKLQEAGDPLDSLTNNSGGIKSYALVVDNGNFSAAGTGSAEDVIAEITGLINPDS